MPSNRRRIGVNCVFSPAPREAGPEKPCEVEAQERITVVSGEYDTFKVVCDNPWTVSTTHVAPRANNVVAIIRTPKDQNQTSIWEMVRFEPAKPSS